jgi:hypothetical protein
MQFDRNGNRAGRHALAMLESQHARRAVREVPVPTAAAPNHPTSPQAAMTAHPVPVRRMPSHTLLTC